MGPDKSNPAGAEELCPVCGNTAGECVCCPECGHACSLDAGEAWCPVCGPVTPGRKEEPPAED